MTSERDDALGGHVDTTRRHGRAHIARGWPVFLLAVDGPEGKIPTRNCPRCDVRTGERHDRETCGCLLCHGFYAATLDPVRFDAMVDVLPGGYLAIRTGTAARLMVLDVEARGVADGVLDEWELLYGESLPPTLTATSQAGGRHLYYALDEGEVVRSGRVLPDVDVKAEGGLVAAVGSRHGRRVWLDESVPVARRPDALLAWLSSTDRRRAGGSGGGSGGSAGAGHSDGYDYVRFARDGCPGGYRDEFFNDLLFRGRVQRGLDGPGLWELGREHWERCAQPPDAEYEMPWEHVEYKVERVLHEVEPAAGSETQRAWLRTVQPRPGSTTVVEGEVIGQPPTADEDLTPTGNSHRFVRLFEDQALFVPGLERWHLWDGNGWRVDDLNDVFDITQEVLAELRREQANAGVDREAEFRSFHRASSTMQARAAMLTGAAADHRMKAHIDSLNSDPYSLVVRDGTLDLRELKRRDSQPKDHNTQVAGVRYVEGAECPGWRAHITKITAYTDGTPDPNLAAFIQRWAGYTLTGLVSEQKFFFGFGSGANGKNVTTEVLLGLMGTYAMRGSAKIITGDSREHETIIADLAGMRMVFIDEIPHGRINEARLKELTGTERVRARRIARDSFEFQLHAKIWIAGNNRPNVEDSSEGFWRRLDLVPFDVTLPPGERVRDYARVLLDSEGPGILNWALEGLRAYHEQGLEAPERVRSAGEEYRSEQNTTGQWARDTFDVESVERVWVPNKVLILLYERWCREQNVRRTLSMRQLSEDLRHMKEWFTRSDKTRRVRWCNSLLGTQGDRSQPERGWLCPPIMTDVPLGTNWTVG